MSTDAWPEAIRDLLQTQIDSLVCGLQNVNMTFAHWHTETCCDLSIFASGDRDDATYALGYLQCASHLAGKSLLDVIDEYELDTVYQCADCEASTAPWHTNEPHVCG